MLNTGTISFLLYSIFILIAFISVVIVYVLLKKGTLEPNKLDKLIDFFKTVIYTTAIGTVALIITNLFKEREQTINELEYFDKYVQEVKEVNGQGRLQLSKYLSIVAPSGEMKTSWTNYYTVVKKEYDEYLKAQLELKDTSNNLTKPQIEKREQNETKVELFESPLTMSKVSEWFIIAGGDTYLKDAKNNLDKAIKITPNSVIIKKLNSYRTVLRGFSTRSDAEVVLKEVRNLINPSAYIVSKNSWCNNIEQADEYLICN